MKKPMKIIVTLVVSIMLIGAISFYVWTQQTYKGTAELERLVPAADVKTNGDWFVFEPKVKTEAGIILYPGAKVDPLAYRYVGQKLSEAGYFVVIPKMTLNLAIFSTTEARNIMKSYGNIKGWVVGGHSLGGVAAADYVYEHSENVYGLLLLASYPTNETNFSGGTLSTLSIYAENDLVTTPQSVMDSQKLLSTTAVLHEIAGGNHAGFGMYGNQKDDGIATITPLEQQERVVYQTVRWLDKITGKVSLNNK